jgi:ParB-like chromosome segregation protein Spo0J
VNRELFDPPATIEPAGLIAEVVEIGGEAFTMTFENVVPPIEAEQLAGLDVSIKDEGIKVPVIRDQHGRVIDGYNRLRLAIKHGKDAVPVEEIEVRDDNHARELAIVLNLQRRHLSSHQRGILVDALLAMNPEKSNRQIAEKAGVHHEMVQTRREKMESTGGFRQLKKTVGKDGKARTAKRKPRKSAGQKAGEEAQASLNGQKREPNEEAPAAEEPTELFDQAEQPIPPQAYEAFNQLPETALPKKRLPREKLRISAITTQPVAYSPRAIRHPKTTPTTTPAAPLPRRRVRQPADDPRTPPRCGRTRQTRA